LPGSVPGAVDLIIMQTIGQALIHIEKLIIVVVMLT